MRSSDGDCPSATSSSCATASDGVTASGRARRPRPAAAVSCSWRPRSATSATCRRGPSRCWRRPPSCAARTPDAPGDCSPTPACSAARLAVANDHTERARIDDVLAVLAGGGDVAVVTDAGTPGISDPGERLVRAALDEGFDVTTVPGPAAFVAALVSSGLSTSRFVFEGFLPRRGSERRARLAEVAAERRTVVLYEAPHRIAATIADLAAACGPDRPVAVARELDQAVRDDPARCRGRRSTSASPAASTWWWSARRRRSSRWSTTRRSPPPCVTSWRRGASTKDAAAAVARRLGIGRREAYAIAVASRTRRAAAPPSGQT